MKKLKNSGFSLVEMLVAGAVLAVVILAVVSMVRKAQEIDSLNRHRRAAHSIIERTLESGTYQQINFNNLVNGTTTTPNIVIDPRSNLMGTLTVTVTLQIPGPTWSGIAVPQARVTVTVSWNELRANNQTTAETMSIEKWL
jgi:prepilin-type N-terminal cleavage/methylation domain-containing protein